MRLGGVIVDGPMWIAGMRLYGAQEIAIRDALASIAEIVWVVWMKIELGKVDGGSMNGMACGHRALVDASAVGVEGTGPSSA